MTSSVIQTLFRIACLSLFVFTTQPAWPQSKDATEIPVLQVGFGQMDITPVRPTPMAGYYAQGNYEVVSARCAEGSGEMLVDSALKQLITHFAVQNQ